MPLDDDQVDKIRYYVAAANAGMKPENVTIADANGTHHTGVTRTMAAPTAIPITAPCERPNRP